MTRVASLGLLGTLALCGCAPDPISVAEDQRVEGSTALTAALAAGEIEERVRAAEAMGRIQSPTYVAPLLRALADDDNELRGTVLFALGQLALAEGPRLSRSVLAAMTRSLEDPDSTIVALALEGMGKWGEPVQAHRIYPLLAHSSEQVREAAALALFRCRFVPVWRDAAESAPELPDVAVSALIAAFDDNAATVRRAAVYAFARYGQAQANAALIEALIETLSDDDEWTRMFATRALGLAGEPSAVDSLLDLLGDASEHVRTEVVVAVAALGGRSTLPESVGSDASFHVRAALARALADVESSHGLETLRALEGDPSPTVRAAAIEALAERLKDGYRDDIARHLRQTEWPIRVSAVRAAGRLGPSGRALLESALGDSDLRVRAGALEILGRSGEVSLPAVREALSSSELAIRGTAADLLAEIEMPDKPDVLRRLYAESPGDEWIEIRKSAVAAASTFDEGRALVWNAARKDPARAVRDRAIVALRARSIRLPQVIAAPREASPLLGKRFRQEPVVVLETTKGAIEIRALSRAAPVHVASFVALVRKKFYDGLPWHRVVPNFVIQGGDPQGTGWGGPGYTLRDETNSTRFERGTVGMPKAGRDTGGCQIFITHVPTPHLDGNYTVFGKVVSGMEVVDRIEVGDRILTARLK